MIARRVGLVVFCEVKTRTNRRFGTPAEAVTMVKQARLRRLAGQWLAQQPSGRRSRIRFDVAAVEEGQVEMLEAAF